MTSFHQAVMKSDRQLQQDVIAELDWEPSLTGCRIGVQVLDGVVTLTGLVRCHLDALNAELASQRVVGVQALVTEISVISRSPERQDDEDIADAARHALKWTAGLPPSAVGIHVDKGHVTMTGTVPWHYQRTLAQACVGQLCGLRGLRNQIDIEPTLELVPDKGCIDAAIRRLAVSRLRPLLVEVVGGDVYLSGSMPSWHERDLATSAAWSSPGVRRVISYIALV
ncbi:BON domain-containing protein [Roseateles sp. DB2]|uniref:BON domain-containing protein n=1 Tax=Roseateles sp. DB2 TaxID=3453717 RepID=UPI003EEE7F95